jgi:tetratricopeptide (TPR) repeat protein
MRAAKIPAVVPNKSGKMAGNKESFQKAMNQGHSAAWDQEWEKSADFYQAALDEFPNHPQAITSLGLALFELQNYTAALECYQKAAGLTPEDPMPQEKIARIYERLGRLNEAITTSLQAAEMHLKARSAEKAIDNWIRVLTFQPENIHVRTRLAAVYEKMGRRDEAVAEYISTASILQHSGDLTRAIKAVEYAQRIMPDNQEVRMALSMVRSNQRLPRPNRLHGGTGPVRMAQIREMEGEAEAPIESQPDPISEARQKAMVQLAGMLFDQAEENSAAQSQTRGRGISALARGIAEQVTEGNDQNRIILHLGQAIDSLFQGENQQAVVELEHALNLGLRQPAGYFMLCLLTKDIHTEKALKYAQQSVKHPDFTLASNLLIAQIYEKDGKWAEAATSYLQALALADSQVVETDQADDLLSQYDAIIDTQASVKDTEALKATAVAIASQLNRPDWRSSLSQTRQNLPPAPEGFPISPVAEMLLEARNSQVIEAVARVRQLAARGALRSASEEALYALQFAPVYLPLHVIIGDLLLQENRPEEAVKKYQIVADLYTVRGETTRAVRLLKRIAQIMPSDIRVRLRLIDMLSAQGKIDEALTEYTRLAELFYTMADLEKARQTYLDALKIAQKSKEPREWGVTLLLKAADIDVQRLNLRQALRIYEQVRTIQPDHTPTRAIIIGLNFRLGQDTAALKELDEAMTYLENASRRRLAIEFIIGLLVDYADRTDLRRRLADLYIRAGETAEAVTQLDTVADLLLAANKNLEAVNMMETIISLNPPNVQEYRAALESLRREMLRK